MYARILSGVATVVLFASVAFPSPALAITPMGGLVTFMRPCNSGYLVTVINPGGIGSGEYMWTPGTISFLYGPPRVGAWTLGTTDTILPCFLGKIYIGQGQRITINGTSLGI